MGINGEIYVEMPVRASRGATSGELRRACILMFPIRRASTVSHLCCLIVAQKVHMTKYTDVNCLMNCFAEIQNVS